MSEKRYRQSLKRHLRNKMTKSEVKTYIKDFTAADEGNDKAEAEKTFILISKKMDTAAGKGIYHKNTVARKKSRLAKKLNKLNAG